MTKTEIETIRNIVKRLKAENLGCAHGSGTKVQVDALNTSKRTGEPYEGSARLEVASRLYLDTWIVPALEYLLPESRDPDLAKRLSR